MQLGRKLIINHFRSSPALSDAWFEEYVRGDINKSIIPDWVERRDYERLDEKELSQLKEEFEEQTRNTQFYQAELLIKNPKISDIKIGIVLPIPSSRRPFDYFRGKALTRISYLNPGSEELLEKHQLYNSELLFERGFSVIWKIIGTPAVGKKKIKSASDRWSQVYVKLKETGSIKKGYHGEEDKRYSSRTYSLLTEEEKKIIQGLNQKDRLILVGKLETIEKIVSDIYVVGGIEPLKLKSKVENGLNNSTLYLGTAFVERARHLFAEPSPGQILRGVSKVRSLRKEEYKRSKLDDIATSESGGPESAPDIFWG